ncbi:nucleotidyltransferase domain-containing protein [Actinokineospora sp. PR83]|uniref:nucleotidyltransferase domain-containing protein n=1 Tax=Actinokineospora sp. PR83 TaxID=2884908 RepID=UPI001F3B2B81|nr:nucleotidyltransferase domain-containing protein [Actinokineospora sp. PR83]MCG8918594.1 nucleotidyltransferase domain-containing protein [Actinokineospora sp. PR83]
MNAQNVPTELSVRAWSAVEGKCTGALLYGSWARQDAQFHSDLDLLILNWSGLVPKPGPKISVSRYSSAKLLSSNRTLFGMHLSRDSVIFHDPYGDLGAILDSFEPPDPIDLLSRIKKYSMVLDVAEDDLKQYLPGLTQVARYLLRTAIYALALQQGNPCFSLKELAERFETPEYHVILSSHAEIYPSPTSEVFNDLVVRLQKVLGVLPSNPFGSLHGLIVGMSSTERDVSNLGTFALGSDESLPYDEIERIVL